MAGPLLRAFGRALRRALLRTPPLRSGERRMVGPSGFEPEQRDPKSLVLPLHHGPVRSIEEPPIEEGERAEGNYACRREDVVRMSECYPIRPVDTTAPSTRKYLRGHVGMKLHRTPGRRYVLSHRRGWLGV